MLDVKNIKIDLFWITHPTSQLVALSKRDLSLNQNMILHFRWPVPIALHIMVSLNHFLQVVNSSINFIIYCCVAKRFRNELKSVLSSTCQRLFGRRETQDKETQVTDGIDVLQLSIKNVLHSNLDIVNKSVIPFLFTISNNSLSQI